jgi:hypothetical protein
VHERVVGANIHTIVYDKTAANVSTLPTLSGTFLVLLGISYAGYVGGKIPNQPAATQPAPPAAVPVAVAAGTQQASGNGGGGTTHVVTTSAPAQVVISRQIIGETCLQITMSPLLKILGAVFLIFAGEQFTKGKDGPIESDLAEFANWIIPKEVLGRSRQVNALSPMKGCSKRCTSATQTGLKCISG